MQATRFIKLGQPGRTVIDPHNLSLAMPSPEIQHFHHVYIIIQDQFFGVFPASCICLIPNLQSMLLLA